MEYRWRSPVGVWRIRHRADGRWTLLIEQEPLGSYATANMAADDVHQHATGHYPWDNLMLGPHAYSAPEDVSGWTASS